jgi:hypothetical protein
MKLTDLPALPYMPILEETPEEIYQRWVNRAIELAKELGQPPPPTDEGEFFYKMWYPIAQEYAEQQELWTYGFIQGFPIWADGEFLEAHGWADGVPKKEGEDDDDYRLRLLDHAFIEEGNGRRKDYETWAKEIQGVGGAIAIEKARHDNSIDLYLTDMNGQPVTPEFAEQVKNEMWEEKRIAGHDLATYPAPIFTLHIEATIETTGDRAELAERIKERVLAYAEGRTKLIYNYVAALLIVDIGENYSAFTINGMTEDVEIPPVSILQVEVVLS